MYNLENAPSGRIKGITQALGISTALSHRDIVSESHKKEILCTFITLSSFLSLLSSLLFGKLVKGPSINYVVSKLAPPPTL